MYVTQIGFARKTLLQNDFGRTFFVVIVQCQMMQLENTLIMITAPGIYFDFPCILPRKQYSILTSKTSHSRVFPSSFPKNIYHAVGGCYSTGFFLFFIPYQSTEDHENQCLNSTHCRLMISRMRKHMITFCVQAGKIFNVYGDWGGQFVQVFVSCFVESLYTDNL